MAMIPSTPGDDTIDGTPDGDQIEGGLGNDVLRGLGGNDYLDGGVGNDKLYGGDGDDSLHDDFGSNELDGGAGNDSISVRHNSAMQLWGGAGNDTFWIEDSSGTADGGAGNDKFTGAPESSSGPQQLHLIGGDGNDEFLMWPHGVSSLLMTGGAGQDVFTSLGVAGTTVVIDDFVAGANGDQLSLIRYSDVIRASDNPFADGYLKFVQQGADTALMIDRDGPEQSESAFSTIALLKNVVAADITVANIAEGIDPLAPSRQGWQIGDEGDNTLTGSAFNDVLAGYGGNDTLSSGAGDDVIDGGAGTDLAIMTGTRASYTIRNTGSGFHLDAADPAAGFTMLLGVERVKFSDGMLGLDVDGIGGQIYRIYRAAFDRAPDDGGLGYWISKADQGMSLAMVAEQFVESAEFSGLYGADIGNGALLDKLYQNVLDRAPDAGGKAYWVDLLDRQVLSVPQVLASFSESAENVAALADVIGNGFSYTAYGS